MNAPANKTVSSRYAYNRLFGVIGGLAGSFIGFNLGETLGALACGLVGIFLGEVVAWLVLEPHSNPETPT